MILWLDIICCRKWYASGCHNALIPSELLGFTELFPLWKQSISLLQTEFLACNWPTSNRVWNTQCSSHCWQCSSRLCMCESHFCSYWPQTCWKSLIYVTIIYYMSKIMKNLKYFLLNFSKFNLVSYTHWSWHSQWHTMAETKEWAVCWKFGLV
jgi:hypothetical protein